MILNTDFNSLASLRKSIKEYLVERRPDIRLKTEKGTNSLLYRFNEALISVFSNEQDNIDAREDAIRSIALRSIRFAGKNPTLGDLAKAFDEDSAVKLSAEYHGISKDEILRYVQEHKDNLENNPYLTRGGNYPSPNIIP